MDIDSVLTIIDMIAKEHMLLGENVDFTTENRKRAIWYMQGAIISSCFTVWDMYQRGHAASATREWRYVNEVRYLITLFESLSDNDRRVKAWYKGHVVEIGRKENLPSKPHLTSDFYDTERTLRNKHLDDLSKFIHPTITVVRYNVFHGNDREYFAYDGQEMKYFSDTIVIIKTAIICALDGLLLPITTAPISPELRKKLTETYEIVKLWSHN